MNANDLPSDHDLYLLIEIYYQIWKKKKKTQICSILYF